MKLIRNAIIYTVSLPSIDRMAIHLAELPHEPLGEAMLSRASFVANEITGELVTPVPGGFAICMRYDEKIIPSSAVRAKVNERVARIKAEESRSPGKKERDEIRESVVVEMARVAFIKTVIIHAFYQIESGHLIVATSSKSLSNMLTGNLVKVVGSIKSKTINVSDLKHGLTVRLRSWLDGIEAEGATAAFTPFGVGSHVQLKGIAGERLSVHADGGLDAAREGLTEALGAGFGVERIALEAYGLSFHLTSDFQLKSVKFDAIDAESDDDLDAAAYWRHEAGAQMAIVAAAVKNLCDLVGYVPPAQDVTE